jgi:hypothetical protein
MAEPIDRVSVHHRLSEHRNIRLTTATTWPAQATTVLIFTRLLHLSASLDSAKFKSRSAVIVPQRRTADPARGGCVAQGAAWLAVLLVDSSLTISPYPLGYGAFPNR